MSNAVEPTRENNQPEGHDQFTVADMANQNARYFESRSDADDALDKAQGAPGVEPKLFPPGDSPEWLYHGDDGETLMGVDGCVHCGADIDDGWCPECDGEKGGNNWTPGDDGTPAAQAADPTLENGSVEQVPDAPNLTDDPFAWMPGDFVDTIDGTPTINRRGYAALGRKFGISAPDITVHVGPEETDHAYCRVQATVEDDDGRTYQNHGSASVERGDDPTLLLELAVTRGRKRALAGATGVGLIAVEELKNEL